METFKDFLFTSAAVAVGVFWGIFWWFFFLLAMDILFPATAAERVVG